MMTPDLEKDPSQASEPMKRFYNVLCDLDETNLEMLFMIDPLTVDGLNSAFAITHFNDRELIIDATSADDRDYFIDHQDDDMKPHIHTAFVAVNGDDTALYFNKSKDPLDTPDWVFYGDHRPSNPGPNNPDMLLTEMPEPEDWGGFCDFMEAISHFIMANSERTTATLLVDGRYADSLITPHIMSWDTYYMSGGKSALSDVTFYVRIFLENHGFAEYFKE